MNGPRRGGGGVCRLYTELRLLNACNMDIPLTSQVGHRPIVSGRYMYIKFTLADCRLAAPAAFIRYCLISATPVADLKSAAAAILVCTYSCLFVYAMHRWFLARSSFSLSRHARKLGEKTAHCCFLVTHHFRAPGAFCSTCEILANNHPYVRVVRGACIVVD
jgi:hypothetical protein